MRLVRSEINILDIASALLTGSIAGGHAKVIDGTSDYVGGASALG